MDRYLINKLDKGISIAERIAESLEKLVDEPMVEVQSRPPQCPHCGVVNPTVEIGVQAEIVTGKLANYLIESKCTNCEKVFWSIPSNWTIVSDWNSVLEIANRVKEVSNVG